MKIKSLQVFLGMLFISILNLAIAEDKKVLYKSIDENGNVTYSDKPSSNSTEIPMSEGQSINMKPPKIVFHSSTNDSNNDSNQQTNGYVSVSFLQPENDGVIRNNGGVALFVLNVLPQLSEADHIVFYIDGSQVEASISGMDVTVLKVVYGTHTASFAVLDNTDKLMIKSAPLTFNLLHTVRRKVGAVNNYNSPINKINTDVLVASQLKIELPEHPKPLSFEQLRKREN
ncbi:MAG: hypothetical protein COA86_18295 [Kangiella sp.]|nr:MAG: hypothetical protein COA86_18295 [Kangiella sp.]